MVDIVTKQPHVLVTTETIEGKAIETKHTLAHQHSKYRKKLINLDVLARVAIGNALI